MNHSDVYEVTTASGSRWLIDIVSGLLMRQPGPGADTYARDGYIVIVGDFLQVEVGLPLLIRPYPGRNDHFAPLESTPVESMELKADEDPMTWPIHPADRGAFWNDDTELD